MYFLMIWFYLLIYTFLVMYREYDMLNKYTVECTVYCKAVSRMPLCILRYDLLLEQLFVERFLASNLRIITEVQYFLGFLETPHWRDTVKHSQYRYGSLFESDNAE